MLEAADTRLVPRLFNTQVPTDPLALHSKILSLELILSVGLLRRCLLEGEKFIYLVQNYLCVAFAKELRVQPHASSVCPRIFLVLVGKPSQYLLLRRCRR
jgi:hypothetical protein